MTREQKLQKPCLKAYVSAPSEQMGEGQAGPFNSSRDLRALGWRPRAQCHVSSGPTPSRDDPLHGGTGPAQGN